MVFSVGVAGWIPVMLSLDDVGRGVSELESIYVLSLCLSGL